MLIAHHLRLGPVVDVSLELGPGLTVMTGEPECGTSTLLRLLAGADRAESGSVGGDTTALLETPPGTEWSKHDTAADALGAPHLVGREMWTLSGGERQRVRLANLLRSPAGVLLLDEPLGYLDAGGRAMVINTLKADGRPVLVACKSDEAILVAADQVLTMAEGRLT